MRGLFGVLRHEHMTAVHSHWHSVGHHASPFARDIAHGIAYSAVWHAVGQLFYSARQFVAGSFSWTQIVVCAAITIALLLIAAALQRRFA